ncbi:stonustoxin subunit beta-like [Perca fluviatilis]|uniref:stonustoxin subunit beta-like n=1 Tax=Perca fluviatilis TaxID=8168 RepID=UPI001964AE2A|nr:stonustoxin subunit beta-like [Perca fluviatilis]
MGQQLRESACPPSPMLDHHPDPVGEWASGNMNVAALGRPFTLGMLYDARTDNLIPGLTLWDDKTLQGKISESSQRTSKSHISTSDSTESKCKLLDVEVSLKASVLGGLIEFGGSAKYLNDQKKFLQSEQSDVSVQNYHQLQAVND